MAFSTSGGRVRTDVRVLAGRGGDTYEGGHDPSVGREAGTHRRLREGQGGAGRGGEVSERPPPTTKAITVTAAVPPPRFPKGKTLWDTLDTLLQIHRDLPFPSIQFI